MQEIPVSVIGEKDILVQVRAAVDVWDVLTSDRPYRPAWPKEKVREHIRTLSGTHLDPNVVPAFLRLMEQTSRDAQK